MKSSPPHMLVLAAEDFSIVLNFAHSRQSFNQLRATADGEWKHLDRLLYEIPELRADRALLEMAYLLRSIDDMEGISHHFANSFGTLHLRNGNDQPLGLRDVTNKIIHAERYEWSLDNPEALQIQCVGEAAGNWSRADILIDKLAFAFGQMAV